MKDVTPKFAVVAINAETGVPSLMSYAETLPEAEEMQRRATRFGWHGATICDSPEQLHDFGKVTKP